MTSGRQLSETVEHKLPQSPCEEVNPQLINAYTRNMSPQHGSSQKWRSGHVCCFIQKCSIRNISVPPHFHGQQHSLQSLLAASEDLSAFKSCRFQALLPDHSQSPWPQAKLFLNLCFTANSLQKQACPRPPTLAVLCVVQREECLSVCPPLTTSQARAPEPNSRTNYLWLPDTPVQD